MKKLVLTAFAVTAAFAASAASVDWGFSETAQSAKSPYEIDAFTAYLFTASTWEAASEVTADTFNSAVANAALTKNTLGGGAVYQWTTGTQTWTSDQAASGNYYVVIFDGKDYAASSSIAATAYASAQESHTAGLWQITAAATPLKAGDFTSTGAVPEPTSGLLILLGMAGLALKRKHA